MLLNKADINFNPTVTEISLLDTPKPFINKYVSPKNEIEKHTIILPSKHEAINLTSYEDVKKVLLDSTASRELCNFEGGPMFMPVSWVDEALINLDNPQHEIVKKFSMSSFSSKELNLLLPIIEKYTSQSLEKIKSNREGDLVHDLFTIVPAQVLCDFLGIPIERARWMNDLGKVIQVAPADNLEKIAEAWDELFDYVADLVDEKEEFNDSGLISKWLHKMEQPEYSEMTTPLLKGTLMGVVLGGDNNIATMLTKIAYSALAYPSFYKKLSDNPDDVVKFNQEILRLMPLGKPGTFPRKLTNPLVTSIGSFPEGTIIYPNIIEANRDPKYFKNPLEINMNRVNEHTHLQFGYGMHKCMGIALAQLELNFIIKELVKTLPFLKLTKDPKDISWIEGMGLRRPNKLEVEF